MGRYTDSKLLGKEVGFWAMRDRRNKLWKPCGGFEIIDLGYGFFLVKFDNEDDRTKSVGGGHGCCLITISPFDHGQILLHV